MLGLRFGLGIAVWIGQANFHAPVMPRFERFSGGFGGQHRCGADGGDSANFSAAAGATCYDL